MPSDCFLEADILVIGGGVAGLMAAVAAREVAPGCRVLVLEKGHVERSGCLAAGVNAINAYLLPGQTPDSFLGYVRRDSAGLLREDLVYSLACRLNQTVDRLESWGVPFPKDAAGNYLARGPRSIAVHGERLKPILARMARDAGVQVLNRAVTSNYWLEDGRVVGAFAFNSRSGDFYAVRAGAVVCSTGGAAGLYRPANPGSGRHRGWYPPFNTGAGYALGIRAGAEMTSLEMRFIALRVKDSLAPTGTVAQGVRAPQINARGEEYLKHYLDRTTAGRLAATLEQERLGLAPCYLDTSHLTPDQEQKLIEAYLEMCPSQVLAWADQEAGPSALTMELAASEPYIVGGHAGAGYWVNLERQTSLPGLFAAGDVAGGAPKKYVSGCLAEGEIAGRRAAAYAMTHPVAGSGDTQPLSLASGNLDQLGSEQEATIKAERWRVFHHLVQNEKRERWRLEPGSAEERLQKVMDEYAGGRESNYLLSRGRLLRAAGLLKELRDEAQARLVALDYHGLLQSHQVLDRLDLAVVLVEHLLYREESRWPVYQQRADFPQRDDTRWLVFVNSTYDAQAARVNVIERPCHVLGEEEKREILKESCTCQSVPY